MAETYQRIIIEAELSAGVWTPLPDVLQKSGIQCTSGMRSPDIKTMVAEAGTMVFTLRNDKGCSGGVSHYYTPGHLNCLAGWEVGKRVRLVLGWRGERFIVWVGRIMVGGISITADLYAPRVTVTARDYMEELALHAMVLPHFTTNKTMAEVVPLIIANMPIKPMNTSYNATSTVFNTVFDTVWTKTRAMGELNKLAMSELGYVYLRNEFHKPEVLTVIGRNYRSTQTRALLYETTVNTTPLETEDGSPIETEDGQIIYLQEAWLASVDTTAIETEDGDPIETEDGEIIYLSDSWVTSTSYAHEEARVFNNAGRYINIVNGLDYLNYIKITTHPRTFDAVNVNLFSLGSPISVPAGTTLVFTGAFTDPAGKAVNITAQSTETPVAGTDYNLSSVDTVDSGNLNASCVLSRTYGANGFEDTISNTGAVDGYVTKLLARGKGVYLYEAIGTVTKDDEEILQHGNIDWDLDCPYLDSPFVAADYLVTLRDKTFDMRTDIVNYSYVANKDALKMQAFLTFTIGDKIVVSETEAGISTEYWIYGKDWVIGEGGVTLVDYILRNAEQDVNLYWILGTGALDTTTVLGS